MKLPAIKFSKWVKWPERKSIKNSDYPGVYLLAKFKRIPAGRVNPLNKSIVYIGETCNNTLKGRWYQFHCSAHYNKEGHSGGFTYFKKYRGNVDDLFVAALPVVNIKDNLRHLLIRYIERKLILEYAIKHRKQPECNKK